jgi:uncharacterized protein YbaP (TraB family)
MRRADVVPDSVAMATEALSADTAMVTPADSLANDTASQRTDLEAPVVYQSQDSMVWYKNGNAYLYGSGQVNYQKIELKANEITIDLETSTVYAQGTTDTLGNVTGRPVFADGETPYESETMSYNFKSRKGFINNVTTQQGEGYMTSNTVKKGANDEFYIRKGRYTTCEDHEHPHFYLSLSTAKMRPNKDVVFGPAQLVVADVPLPLAVPFGFFPFTSDYSSGFIMPSYGDELERGFYLRDGGYYFAFSDYLDLKLTEEFADRICRYLNNELWGDEEFLTGLASAYETTTNEAYLAIDGTTGFPTAIGVNYAGEHTIEGQAYVLSMQTDQTYELASQSAYKAITDENPPTEEPDNKATPLFYHVTGADGQEMWLFGTIHVGDVRTAYLPKEIYDAFDAADSLAVEFDSDKFYEQMENDKDLQKLASDAYYYSDGTTTKDHIEDEEVYDYAEKLMKATGNFNMNALVMKPSIWGNSIENFYLKMGYRLHSGYGMDNLLMERAREQEKPIVDVESGIEQMQMLGGYSDALQEYLLCSTLSTAALEYQTEVQELFELWCSGDEAKMIAYLNEEDEEPDTSTMTQEELDEYNRVQELMDEYNSAMSSDRNVEMLKAAIDYLESDKVVFYAVGLAHLLAEDGLVNTLRDAGYTVELVTYS